MVVIGPSLDSWLDFENSKIQCCIFFLSSLLYESNELQHQFATKDEIHKQIYSWFCDKLRIWIQRNLSQLIRHPHFLYICIFTDKSKPLSFCCRLHRKLPSSEDVVMPAARQYFVDTNSIGQVRWQLLWHRASQNLHMLVRLEVYYSELGLSC